MPRVVIKIGYVLTALFLSGCSTSKSSSPEDQTLVVQQEEVTPTPPPEHSHHDHHHKAFKGAEEWAKEFDDPQRDQWQRPQDVLRALELKKTDNVADIGSGTGYFTVKIAPLVPQGTVYGVDVEKDMIRYLESRAKALKLSNVAAVLAEESGFTTDKKLDVVLVVNTYHHIPNRSAYFKGLIPHLNSGARIVIVDFLPKSPMGPPQKHRYQPPQIKSEMQQAGYRFVKQKNLPYQFILTFQAGLSVVK